MPTFESFQFGSFDGKDNRRELMILFERLGSPEKRADFLQRLVRLSGNGFSDKMVKIVPCDPVTAYFTFTSITGVLGVDVNRAARMLEDEVRRL